MLIGSTKNWSMIMSWIISNIISSFATFYFIKFVFCYRGRYFSIEIPGIKKSCLQRSVEKLSYRLFPYFEIVWNISKYMAGFWIVLPPPGNLVLTLKTEKTNFLKMNYELLNIYILRSEIKLVLNLNHYIILSWKFH